ncbi:MULTISPECIES: VOC family protein [unclassified Ornithinimicrobium]|uniref:VOC family protein n=1 Tax=unclassified Ornithinimicrobium TaxID=2615080 RepID=UPI0038553C25
MTLQIIHITVDCADAARLATFWGAALGLQAHPRATAEFASLAVPDRGAPGWLFFQVPEGKTAKNRLHLDLGADDLDAETERLVGLGARVLHEKHEWGTHWRTLADPEGNEFCVVGQAPD